MNQVCKLLATIICLTLSSWSFAQSDPISESIQIGNAEQLSINCQFANVILRESTDDEITLEGDILINRGEANASFTLAIKSSSSEIVISTTVADYNDLPSLAFGIKDGEQTYLGKASKRGWNSWDKWKYWRKANNHSEPEDAYEYVKEGPEIEVDLVINVPRSMKIEMESTYGHVEIDQVGNPMKVKNTYGAIDAVIDNVEHGIQLFSVYSTVDLTIPNNINADLDLSTNYGDIYTDLDMEIDRNDSVMEPYKHIIKATMNSGGTDIALKATYSNVYVRKT